MKRFTKTLLIGTGFLAAGLYIASSFNDPENPGVMSTIKNVSVAIRNTLQQYVKFSDDGVSIGRQEVKEEKYPRNDIRSATHMDDEEISESQKFFNRLAGLDPKELAKQKEEKKKAEEEALKAAEEAAKKSGETAEEKEKGAELPESLWPRKRRREGIIEVTGHKTGAVYNKGALPYGPPPFVRSEIFSDDSRLQIRNDPESMPSRKIDIEDHDDINYGPDSFVNIPEIKPMPEKIEAPIMKRSDAYTVQLGAFDTRNDAQRMADKLVTKGFNVGIYQGDTMHKNWYYVRLNEKETEQSAMDHAQEIMEQHGIFPLVVPTKEHERRIK